jgi:acyl CoA:acetate/3-ketoacid CoA transferase beta subunit
VTTTHTRRDGKPKILEKCTLPLTAKGCVSTIITEIAVIDVTVDGMVLREVAEGTKVEEVLRQTEAELTLCTDGIGMF